ncbi:MAG: lipopolysaccharide heptosyltransferase II [Planctomycetes bacterium]|nr:lipopolysaccharide heptosyltransferase II [Planctomycetota bacterium]
MERVDPEKILALLPNWVGDAVMATPALSALRRRFPKAVIVCLARPYVVPVLDGLGFVDEIRGFDGLKAKTATRRFLSDARALRREKFDLAVLFANSFRTGLFALLAGAKRRVGYVREGRGFLLTAGVKPVMSGGRFKPLSMIDYYLALVASLDAPSDDRRMQLVVTPADSRKTQEIFAQFKVDVSRPLAVINPGAAFGSAKCWPPENFAAVAEKLCEKGFEVLVVTGPKEKDIGETIGAAVGVSLKPLWRADIPLGALKAVIAQAAVLVTNDSGPRHFGTALGVPVVTIMGPTDPRWSDTGYAREVIVRKEVDCGPCMLRVCPRDHRCMTLITPGDVIAAVDTVLSVPARQEGAETGDDRKAALA